MEQIEIRQDAGRPFGVILRIGDYEYRTTVAPPFDAKGEAELDWYFEEHLRFPFTDSVRARQAGESVTAYGEAMFRQRLRRDAVLQWIESDLIDEAAPLAGRLASLGSRSLPVVELRAPAFRRYFRDQVAPGGDIPPEALQIRRTRENTLHTDDRDGLVALGTR